MKIKIYDVLAVVVVATAILVAGAIEYGLEKCTDPTFEPMMYEEPVTDSECEEYYGFSVEESVEPGLTEGWGTDGQSTYLNDMCQGNGK